MVIGTIFIYGVRKLTKLLTACSDGEWSHTNIVYTETGFKNSSQAPTLIWPMST